MTLEDWFQNLPPQGLLDQGLKMLIYLLVIFTLLSAFIIFLSTKAYKREKGPSLLDLDMETDLPTPTDIPPAERIAILKIEKAKFVAAQKALSESHRKKEISETIFGRLSVRYASDVKKIEDAIEKTTREVEVSQLEEELKKMQGDYLSKIKGEEAISTTAAVPTTAPPAPPVTKKKEKRKRKAEKLAPPTPPTPTTTPSTPPPPSKTTPPPPPGISSSAPPTTVPSPPTPQTVPKAPTPVGSPSIPAPSMPAPKPPGVTTPAPTTGATEGEGDLFAKSTSIAALRKEMLKELDRLKKFMSEQQ
ncbi:MAG: hypothetical protein ACTSX6_09190 [Candidatus Heimdallarchaeaceae archaeon]